jgi:phosphodiesterase/alkaline phosphatase D-like protein
VLGLALAALVCPPALAEDSPTAEVDLRATVVPPPCCVYTLAACDIGYHDANLWGLLICRCRCMPATVSFGWDTSSHKDDPGGYTNWTPAKKLFFSILFHAPVSGLEPGTTYYFRARVQTDSYTGYGEERSFTTLPELRVITLPARDIEKTKATLYGMTISRLSSPKVKVSFGWDISSHEDEPDGYAHWTSPEYARPGDTFDARLTGLEPGTTYYFRARAERDGAVIYGEEMSFTTPKEKHGGFWNWWDWLFNW